MEVQACLRYFAEETYLHRVGKIGLEALGVGWAWKLWRRSPETSLSTDLFTMQLIKARKKSFITV